MEFVTMRDLSRVTPSCYKKICSSDRRSHLRDDINFYIMENEVKWDVEEYANALIFETKLSAELRKSKTGKCHYLFFCFDSEPNLVFQASRCLKR
jgi:hypothetical protein